MSAERPELSCATVWKPITVGEFSEFFDGLPSDTPVRIFVDGEEGELDVACLDTTTAHGGYVLALERRSA